MKRTSKERVSKRAQAEKSGKVIRSVWFTEEEDQRLAAYSESTARPIANTIRYLINTHPEMQTREVA